MRKWTLACVICLAASATCGSGLEPLVVSPVLVTAPLYNYEDAPATPDADDPAIWLNRQPRRSLVIGTAKDAGLLVYDLSGKLRQAVLPPNAPQVLPEDPETPAGDNLMADNPCVTAKPGDVRALQQRRYRLRRAPRSTRAPPRGRGRGVGSRLRSRALLQDRPGRAWRPTGGHHRRRRPRVFPSVTSSRHHCSRPGANEGWRDNPVDDQNTVYGLTVAQGDVNEIFVSQRELGLVRQLGIIPAPGGTLTYQRTRTFLFRTSFELKDNRRPLRVDACREAALEEPQSEGLVFDTRNQTLYVAFETIGLYRVPLAKSTPHFVTITGESLIEPVKSFGRPTGRFPDDDEFECEHDPEGKWILATSSRSAHRPTPVNSWRRISKA